MTTLFLSALHLQAQVTAEPNRTLTTRKAQHPQTSLRAHNLQLGFESQALFTIHQNKNYDRMKKQFFSLNKTDDTRNHRAIYSSLWAFTSLNYLYCDLVGLMDKNVHLQYQSGVVDGLAITPEFLTMAAAFMQIPLANVALPHLIKNDKILQWVQIGSGAVMSLVQAGTLFAGKPSPYYVLFSAIEISTTAYITFDALRWKRQSKKLAMQINEP